MRKQRTIKSSVTISGMGLHTGKLSTLTFHPAPENRQKALTLMIPKKINT